MSKEDNQQEQQEVVEERIIQLSINLPEAPGQLKFPVSVNSSVADITQVLNVSPATQQYTSFKLVIDGDSKAKLDDTVFVEDIVSAEATSLSLTLKQTAYTEKSARDHLVKVREIACLETPSFYNSLYDFSGVNVGASTYSELNLSEVKPRAEKKEEETKEEDKEQTEESKTEKDETAQPKAPEVILSDEEKAKVSEIVSSFTNPINQNAFTAKANLSIAPCLRSLHVSAWAPADHQRNLFGDLLYLQCQTLEGETFHITAHVSGFFVNSSSVSRFDGTPKQVSSANGKAKLSKSHSLLTLLRSLSPKFQEQLVENSKILNSLVTETFAYPTNSFLANPWFVDTQNTQKKQPDLAKSQSNYIEGGLYGADLQKDWNTEYQTLRELEINTQDDRLIQEKLLNKKTYDFTTAAIQGAIAIVKGEISPMNPEDPFSEQIFLHNSIFYSFGDAIQFKDVGGIEAARAAAGKDLNGIKCLHRLNVKGVYHLCTTVVDYCGKRVLCQTPVPGIFNQAPVLQESGELLPESNVVYGSAEEGTLLNADEEFTKAFAPIAEAFHLKSHAAWLKDGSKSVDLVTSLDTKGMQGTDGRKYIIDLYRTTPLDIEFIEKHFDLSKEDSYPHREVTLRNEAVQEWYARQVSVAIKAETERLEKENAGKETKDDEKPELNIDTSKFALNPDAFNLSYDAAPSEEALKQLKADEVTVREASKFVSDVLITEFIRDVANNEISIPIDGTQLSTALHNQGINLRYLGFIAKNALLSKEAYLTELKIKKEKIAKENEKIREEEAEKAKKEAEKAAAKAEAGESKTEEEEEKPKEEKSEEVSNLDITPVVKTLNTVYSIAVNEMISRATKHYLRKALVDVPLPLVSYIIAHVHNALLGSKANPSPSKPTIDEALLSIYDEVDLSILDASPAEIQAAIAKEVYARFRFELPANYADDIKPLALLRDIAIKFGIQWKAREYAFTKEQLDAQVAKFEASRAVHEDDKKKSDKKGRHSSPAVEVSSKSAPSTTFTAEDIVSLIPVVKDSIYRSMMIEEFVNIARKNIAEGDTENALAHVKASVSFNESVYGTIHPDVASSYNALSQFYFDVQMYPEACEAARKAFQIYERTKGIDSYEVNVSLSKIAFGENSNESPVNSYIAYKRMLDQIELVSGDRQHPNYSNALSSIGSSLQGLKMFDEAVKVFTYNLEFVEAGEQLEGLLHYQIGNSYILLDKLQLALEHLEKAAKIFEATLGLKDTSYIQANRWVVQLKNYFVYMKQQQKAEAANASKKGKKQVVSATAQQAQAAAAAASTSTKNGKSKKNKKPAPNPEIAQQSIDDLMNFINGGSNPAKKNKKKA